jgi:hypothetical protein
MQARGLTAAWCPLPFANAQVGPRKTLAGRHSDGGQLSVSFQAVLKDGSGAQRWAEATAWLLLCSWLLLAGCAQGCCRA